MHKPVDDPHYSMPYQPAYPAYPGQPMPYGQMPPGYPPMYPPMPQAYPYGSQPMPMLTIEEAIKDYIRFKQGKGKDHKTLADIELSLNTLSFVRPDIQYVHQINKRLVLEFETLVAQ